jgi:hypothetical protein
MIEVADVFRRFAADYLDAYAASMPGLSQDWAFRLRLRPIAIAGQIGIRKAVLPDSRLRR